MTLYDEAKLLQREVAKLRPDKRRRYPEELRRRLLSWVERAMDTGVQEHECSKLLGVKTWRFTTWRRQATRAERAETETKTAPLAMVPIEVPALSTMAGPFLITPSGYRVEGLSMEQLITLLRELA